jgi:hypothetical protein
VRCRNLPAGGVDHGANAPVRKVDEGVLEERVVVPVPFVWIVECAGWRHSFVGSDWSTFDGAMSWLESNGGCGSCTVTMAEVDVPLSVE